MQQSRSNRQYYLQNFAQNHRLTDISGVVIVDEIDLFLHPEWQRFVIEKIAEAFPKLQFCFSTHSPLVAGTLEPENIFVMETDSNGITIVDQYRENIHGLTANQILTSSYFGLSSTRAPGTEMSEISKLALSGKEADRLEFARRMAEAIPSE
jgi:predicted ATP-binding protein involved in virulence